jgi:hypothetical protein
MTKGIGEKVLGWFIVDEAAGQAEASEPSPPAEAAPRRELVRAREPASLPRAVAAPVVVPGHAHDASAFASVYRAAGVDDAQRERLARVLALLDALPSEATVDVKRAIVAASLEAFGVPIDRIVAAAGGALAALDGYVATGQQRTSEVLDQAEARIARLTAEIAEVRRLMDVQVAAQQELVRATATERARIRVAADFFRDPSPR